MPASLADDLRLALDPVALARAAGIEPDDWQAQVLRSTSPRLLLNCSRQSGKSLTVATLAVHAALYQPNSLVLLLSPSQRQSGELFKKVLDIYRALGRPTAPESESALQLALENGSRIVSLPGKEGTIRGYSGVRLLAIDEAAWVPNDLYLALRPMLAVSQGRLAALSTPHGTRGWWHEAVKATRDGLADWQYVEVPATDCPRISAAFLDEERRTLGDWWYAQEYLCQFKDAQTSAFSRADIDRAFDTEVETWDLLSASA